MVNIIASILDFAVTLLSSGTFWTAISAVGSITALLLIYRQIANSRNVNAYEFLRKEDDRFRTESVRRDRSRLARVLLQCPDDFVEIDKYADDILGYFEDLGLMLRKNLAPIYFAWTMNAFYALHYWHALLPYIHWTRKDLDDPNYYIEFEYLYHKLLKLEQKQLKNKHIEESYKNIREFLLEELQIIIRRSTIADLDRILEFENICFKEDAYPRSQFKDLYKEHPADFYVADILGEVVAYTVGYVNGSTGEIDSLAVDPKYRRLEIAKNLIELLISRFIEQGIEKCSLEVNTTNTSAIALYVKLGFSVTGTIQDYYGPGRHAHVMTKQLAVEKCVEESQPIVSQ